MSEATYELQLSDDHQDDRERAEKLEEDAAEHEAAARREEATALLRFLKNLYVHEPESIVAILMDAWTMDGIVFDVLEGDIYFLDHKIYSKNSPAGSIWIFENLNSNYKAPDLQLFSLSNGLNTAINLQRQKS